MSALNVLNLFAPGRDAADPLTNPRSAAAWLRQLPALDVVGRQQHVMRAFEGMRLSRKTVDLPRVAGIAFLDGALGGDRRQLIKQYIENIENAPRLADRLWQSLHELAQGFLYAYQTALEHALEQAQVPRWRPVIPVLFARLIHYYGTDAKLRVFRFERWIPGRYAELHRLFARALELGIERVPTTLPNASSTATPWTIEQEYLYVLLVHQLNTGNLVPAEIDWASAQLRGWTRRLTLDALPRGAEGFAVDLSGKGGSVRRTGSEKGTSIRYLDTTPVVEQLDRAITALRQAQGIEAGTAMSINQQRIAILERVRPSVAPTLNSDLRRDARVEVRASAQVRVGLGRICRDLGGGSDPDSTSAAEQIEVYAVQSGGRPKRADENDSLVATLGSMSEPLWQVKDRSIAGLRIAASGGLGRSLTLGALVAVRSSDVSEWVVGVVRRLNKASNDDVEAGLAIVAERVVPVTLHARREAKSDMGMIVNGIDVSTIGARFDGLYLPPPSRPDRPLSIKTLIVPTTEYVDGRLIMLMTGRSLYTVALRHLIEQRAEWSWSAIQIVEKKPREF